MLPPVLVLGLAGAQRRAVAGLGALDLRARLAKPCQCSAVLRAAGRVGRLGPKRPLAIGDPLAQPVALKLP